MSDLDRFINGDISFDEIQSFRLQQYVMSAFNVSSLYSKEEHDLYEKLCYAEVLHCMEDYNHEELYAIYLFAKCKCFPHKLDWDGLLEKIKVESGVDYVDIARGTSMYEECQKKGGYYSDLLPTDYYED